LIGIKPNTEETTERLVLCYGDEVVFYVKNGKGLLSTKYGYLEKEALATLVYGNTPLIKFQADGVCRKAEGWKA
jgi:hypothetical protein